MSEKKHRGRIQAQGGGLEESVNWAQDDPLTKEDGLVLLSELKKKLSDKEFKKRAQQFEQAERYIENVEGGIDAVKKKTFRNRKTKDVRVDIEVLAGTAFIIVLLFVLLVIFAFK